MATSTSCIVFLLVLSTMRNKLFNVCFSLAECKLHAQAFLLKHIKTKRTNSGYMWNAGPWRGDSWGKVWMVRCSQWEDMDQDGQGKGNYKCKGLSTKEVCSDIRRNKYPWNWRKETRGRIQRREDWGTQYGSRDSGRGNVKSNGLDTRESSSVFQYK